MTRKQEIVISTEKTAQPNLHQWATYLLESHSLHENNKHRIVQEIENRFEEFFDFIINNHEIFNMYGSSIAAIVASILEKRLLESNHKVENSTQRTDKLLDFVCEKYKNGSLANKVDIFRMLVSMSNMSLFANTPGVQQETAIKLQEFLDGEKKPDGNYYLNQYFEQVMSKGAKLVDAEVSPGQYVYLDRPSEEGGKYYISSPQHKEVAQEILSRLKKLKEEYKENFNKIINKPRLEQADGSLSVVTNFDRDSKDPLVKKHFHIIDELKKAQEEAKSVFKEELNIDYFLISEGSKAPELRLDEDYKIFLYENIRNNFKHRAGFDLGKVSLPGQYNFFEYTKNTTNKDVGNVFEFCKKFGPQGFRTFLSLEQGKEMGDKILTLGEKLPEQSAKKPFAKYGEIVETTNDIGKLLQEELGSKATPEVIQESKDRLLLQGKKLLEAYADKAKNCEGDSCLSLGEELDRKLSLAKTSVLVFGAACRTLVERREFSFEDFKKAQLVYEKSPLPEVLREEIIAMHQENTEQYPDGLKEYWRGTLKDGLEKENPKQMVVYVKYEDSVVSVMRVIEQEEGSWYGASFNVNPNAMGSRIGTELLKEVIKTLAKNKPFVADCYAENPMLDTYIKKFGFEKTNTDDNYHETGAVVHQITLYPEKEVRSS